MFGAQQAEAAVEQIRHKAEQEAKRKEFNKGMQDKVWETSC